MANSFKRLTDDVVHTWSAMPKPQALRWYAALLRHAPTILRERKLYAADRAMRGKLRFSALGQQLTVDVDSINSSGGNAYAFLRELFVRQIYFRAFKTLQLNTCLDLGCNTAVVTGVLKKLAGPNGRVVGIDVNLFPENAFRREVESTPGVTLHHGVLCGESVVEDAAARRAACERFNLDSSRAITIQQLIDTYALEQIDFVKMDIEGAEFAIFRDSIAWLRHVDNFAMEVHNTLGDPREIIGRLREAGFQVAWLDEGGYRTEPRKAGYIYASRTGSLKAE